MRRRRRRRRRRSRGKKEKIGTMLRGERNESRREEHSVWFWVAWIVLVCHSFVLFCFVLFFSDDTPCCSLVDWQLLLIL